MGGDNSKFVETEEKRRPRVHRINGLKNGDTVTVRGEAFAGVDKLFAVNFYHQNDIAFMFKAVLLEAEGVKNKIKMNDKINGVWGTEVRKDNVIFLNHHFEIKFTFKDNGITVVVDGTWFAEYKLRISPDQINVFDLTGDVNWQTVELPNEVKPAAAYSASLLLPSHKEVDVFLKSLRSQRPLLVSAPNENESEQLQQSITEGLEVTKTLLSDPAPGLWGNVVKIGGYLRSIYSAGSAVLAFINGFGKDSDATVFKKKLEEINLQLAQIDRTLQQGFAKLVQQMDFVQYREKVQNKVIALFDFYTRCYSVNGTIPISEFKKLCGDVKESPRYILSELFGFLTSDNNIIESHLNSKEHAYSVYKGWSDVCFKNAIKLITMNIFYYGILCAEHSDSGDDKVLINQEQEIKDLVEQIRRMRNRLEEIEDGRLKTFKKKYAAKLLEESYAKVKHGTGDYKKKLPCDLLPRIAYQLKNIWKGINGPSDFEIIVTRGYVKNTPMHHTSAANYICDEDRVTIVENVGQVTDAANNGICIVLIQPITEELREANRKAYRDHKDTIKETVEEVMTWSPRDAFPKVKKLLSEKSLKPLLILYCMDYEDSIRESSDVGLWGYNYEMSSEAWASPGGPCVQKCFWVYTKNRDWDMAAVRREMQIYFQ